MIYFYPCVPNTLSPNSSYLDDLDRDPQWIAEVKKNGWRCLVMKANGQLILWNRHKRIITDPLEIVRKELTEIPDNTMLDGEIIFTRRVKGIPDQFYLFDIIINQNVALYDNPLHERRGLLEIFYKDYLAGMTKVELAKQIHIGKKALYQQSIGDDLNEGIVLKKLSGYYPVSVSSCRTNPYWLKVKKTEKFLSGG